MQAKKMSARHGKTGTGLNSKQEHLAAMAGCGRTVISMQQEGAGHRHSVGGGCRGKRIRENVESRSERSLNCQLNSWSPCRVFALPSKLANYSNFRGSAIWFYRPGQRRAVYTLRRRAAAASAELQFAPPPATSPVPTSFFSLCSLHRLTIRRCSSPMPKILFAKASSIRPTQSSARSRKSIPSAVTWPQ